MRASALTFLEPVQLPGRVTLDFVQLLGEGCHEGFGLGASLIEAAHFTTEISSDFFLLWVIRVYCGPLLIGVPLLGVSIGLNESLSLLVCLVKYAQVLAPRRQLSPRMEVLTVRLTPLLLF